MHFKSLLHVRDHAKVRGRAHHLLEYIAQHVNRHTGEAFDLSVERLADRIEVTPQWVRQLRTRLVETGELIVKQSRGRHPNVYIIPYERCPACRGDNPKVELPVESIPDDSNPQVDAPQPESLPVSTRNSEPLNPKLGEAFETLLERIEARKDFKEKEERKEGATRKSIEGWLEKLASKRCGWGGCEHPVCPHEVNFCARHAFCQACAREGGG